MFLRELDCRKGLPFRDRRLNRQESATHLHRLRQREARGRNVVTQPRTTAHREAGSGTATGSEEFFDIRNVRLLVRRDAWQVA